MKIKTVIDDWVEFREISCGDAFLWDGKYYLCTEAWPDGLNPDRFNAVNLSTGGVTKFIDDDKVSPVDNCYLAIE